MADKPEGPWYAYAPLSGAVFKGGDPDGSTAGPEDDEEPMLDAQGRRTIRFMEEYTVEYPFWEVGPGPLDAADLSLSDALDRRSRKLMEFWEAHHEYDSGWDAESNRNEWYRRGDKVIGHLLRELGPDFVVRDERWS